MPIYIVLSIAKINVIFLYDAKTEEGVKKRFPLLKRKNRNFLRNLYSEISTNFPADLSNIESTHI
jgi:hypothetical protein